MGIDCEMSQGSDSSHMLPIKISLVDEDGLLLLDTLINPRQMITNSLQNVHGIAPQWLEDAPSLDDVLA